MSTINWTVRTDEDIYGDGDELLVSGISKHLGHRWYDVVVIRCDEGYFAIEDLNGDPWDGNLDDIEFYCQTDKIKVEEVGP